MTPQEERQRQRRLKAVFKMPSAQTIRARKSSITNAFVNSLLPVVRPSADEIAEVLRILGMDVENVRCSYCGERPSEWDHLRPIVLNLRPSGYISEIANLVPSCGKCNQSKGNSDWRTWMTGRMSADAAAGLDTSSVAQRIARLEQFERWRTPISIDFEAIVPAHEYDEYWLMRQQINDELNRCQDIASSIRPRVVAFVQAELLKAQRRS